MRSAYLFNQEQARRLIQEGRTQEVLWMCLMMSKLLLLLEIQPAQKRDVFKTSLQPQRRRQHQQEQEQQQQQQQQWQ
jgi:hypothetical protein